MWLIHIISCYELGSAATSTEERWHNSRRVQVAQYIIFNFQRGVRGRNSFNPSLADRSKRWLDEHLSEKTVSEQRSYLALFECFQARDVELDSSPLRHRALQRYVC